MPELPEVETIASQLSKEIVGERVERVWTDWPKLFQLVKNNKLIKLFKIENEKDLKKANKIFKEFEKNIKGKKVERIERRGKNILFYLSSGYIMLAHQKMTGHFLLGEWVVKNKKAVSLKRGVLDEKINGHIHIIFYFSSGRMLALSDLRKFAKVVLGKSDEILNLSELKDLGPEPLNKNFTFSEFKALFKNKKGKIKTVLMDPKFISGIGNIYSDEILWEAKIHPEKEAGKISVKKLRKMYDSMRKMLKFSIEIRGDSMSDFRDLYGKKGEFQNYHKVYMRDEKKCFSCKEKIKRIKIGSRSARYCPLCQRL